MSDDPELESFLRQFRPLPPGPLARPSGRRGRWWLGAAAAVILAAAGAIVGRLTEHRPPRQADRPPAVTVGAFSASLRTGSYEAALDEMDARVLPDPGRPGGALAVLADVRRDQ
jgi:hypothetical protein